MINKQIYGFTECKKPEPLLYVRFITASIRDDGLIEITIRNERGEHDTMMLPPDEAASLSVALSTATFPFLRTGRAV